MGKGVTQQCRLMYLDAEKDYERQALVQAYNNNNPNKQQTTT